MPQFGDDDDVSDEGVQEKMSKLVVWQEHFATSAALVQYWADGHGTPKPFKYHPW